jgi:hypothetical protein
MNTVWVLIAIAFNGHLNNAVIPTLEFVTREKCEAAIAAFQYDAENKIGTVKMRCVRIEK